MSFHSDSVGWRLVTTVHAPRSRETTSAVCTSRPPEIERMSSSGTSSGGAVSTRRFFLASNTSSAPGSYPGAIITSVNTGASASAKATGTTRLTATMPPNAEVGSPSWARIYAEVMSASTAAPHAFACLMTTAAGSSPREHTNLQAASASYIFRYDISLPPCCSARSQQPPPGKEYRAPT